MRYYLVKYKLIILLQGVNMNKPLISVIVFGFLLLLVLSPFSALAGLMLILLVAATYNIVINLFRAFIGSSEADAKES